MKKDIINVLMAVNKNYLEQMKTLICSLGENNNSIIDIYLIHNELAYEDIELLSNLLEKQCKGKLHEIKVSSSFLKGAKVNEHFSIEMYYRIFATELLPQNLDRILWLDADIVTIRSIENLYFTNLKGLSIGACGHREKDVNNNLINNQALKRLKLGNNKTYFNSGVLLMDLNKIRNNFNKDDILNLIYKMESILENPDQDILNIMYCDDVLVLDKNCYNYQVHYDWKDPNEKNIIQNTVAILHYVGPAKPWKATSNHFTYNYYWKYYLKHGKSSVYNKYKIELARNELVKKMKQFLKSLIK